MRTIIIYRKPRVTDLGMGRYLVDGVPATSETLAEVYREKSMMSLVRQYAKDIESVARALRNEEFIKAVHNINAMEVPK